MTRLLIIFLILLASVWVGAKLSRDPGYLVITLHHWSIETTLAIASLVLIIAFLLFHGLLSLIAKLGRYPAAFRDWKTRRRVQKAQAKTRQGLIEFSEGYWSQAQHHLIKALPNTDTPLLNYLTAARAAQEMGDNHLRDNYLREAQQAMPDAKIAVELTQAQLQLANHQWEQALATLRHLQDLAPRHPYVLKLLMHLYQEVKDWPQLIALLPELKKNQVLDAKAFNNLQQQTYLQAINELANHSQPEALAKLLASLPKELAHAPELVAEYSRCLLARNEQVQAESVLRHCLRKHYNEKLITLYGQVNANPQQLPFAESLLKKQPDSAELYLCLGRLSLQNHLWGKAKTYFEKSIQLTPRPAAYEELGKLLERLSDQIGASNAYRKGLALAIKREPVL
jgi:HemY protein